MQTLELHYKSLSDKIKMMLNVHSVWRVRWIVSPVPLFTSNRLFSDSKLNLKKTLQNFPPFLTKENSILFENL